MEDHELAAFSADLKRQDIDPDQVIYSLKIRDILVCLDYVYDRDLLGMPIEQIRALIVRGIQAAENLPGHHVITLAINQMRRCENG